MDFGKRLERLRKIKNLTQQELATAAGISLGSVSKYEGLRTADSVDLGYLRKLANAMDLEVAQLTGSDPETSKLTLEQLAVYESLKRFLVASDLGSKEIRRLERLRDDVASPKTKGQWTDFWRLVQRMSGRPLPGESKAARDDSAHRSKDRIRVVHAREIRSSSEPAPFTPKKRLSVA
jgi:transcriptional regulator with XRE-family HTH domain